MFEFATPVSEIFFKALRADDSYPGVPIPYLTPNLLPTWESESLTRHLV